MRQRPTIPQKRGCLPLAIDVYFSAAPLPFTYRMANFFIASANYYVGASDKLSLFDPYQEPDIRDQTDQNIPPDA